MQKTFSNKLAYDANKLTEKTSATWLKVKKKSVNRLINFVATIGIFNGLLVVVQSALLAITFDQIIIQQKIWSEILNLLLILAAVFLFRAITNYYFQTLGYQIAVKIKRSVRAELLEKFRLLGPSYVQQYPSGELATATLEHTDALQGYFANYLPQQVIVYVLPVLMILIVLPINWVVAIIFLITGPLIPIFMMLVGMGAESANRGQFLELSRMQGYFFDRLQGLTTLKLFSQAEKEVTKIATVAAEFREKTMGVLRIAFLSSAVLEFFSAVAVALVAVYVGLGLLGLITFGPANHISLQEALFVLLLAPEFFSPLKQLATFYHDKAAAIAASEHVLSILQQPNTLELDQQFASSNFCIELKNVYKSYQQKQVIKGLNLQIKSGERIALTGESGVGKSTLFKLLLGFETVSNGVVLINGQIANIELSAKNIAWVGQQASIFYDTLAANISLSNTNISEQQIEAAVKAAGITEFSQQLELGLNTVIGEKGAGFSGGQTQRVGLARALVKQADIILLDEPTAHLDQSSKKSLLDKMDEQFKDKTLIIATHDSEIMARMDRIVNLS